MPLSISRPTWMDETCLLYTSMMIQAVRSNPSHPEYGVATIPFPIPNDQYAHCMDLLEALEIGDALKADCKVEEIDSFYTILKRTEMLTVNVEAVSYTHL